MKAGKKARTTAAIALAAISAGLMSAGTAGAATPREFFSVVPSGGDSDAQMHRMAETGIGAVRVLIN